MPWKWLKHHLCFWRLKWAALQNDIVGSVWSTNISMGGSAGAGVKIGFSFHFFLLQDGWWLQIIDHFTSFLTSLCCHILLLIIFCELSLVMLKWGFSNILLSGLNYVLRGRYMLISHVLQTITVMKIVLLFAHNPTLCWNGSLLGVCFSRGRRTTTCQQMGLEKMNLERKEPFGSSRFVSIWTHTAISCCCKETNTKPQSVYAGMRRACGCFLSAEPWTLWTHLPNIHWRK